MTDVCSRRRDVLDAWGTQDIYFEWIALDSEKTTCAGSCGRGFCGEGFFCRSSTLSSTVLLPRLMRGGTLHESDKPSATCEDRLRHLNWVSCGGVGGSDGDSVTVTSRMSETDIVASEAISRVKDSDRGGCGEHDEIWKRRGARESEIGWQGDLLPARHSRCRDGIKGEILTAHWKGTGRSVRKGISSQEPLSPIPSKD